MSSAVASIPSPQVAICRYFIQGNCRFGNYCRFSHDFQNRQSTASSSRPANVVEPTTPPQIINNDGNVQSRVQRNRCTMTLPPPGRSWAEICAGEPPSVGQGSNSSCPYGQECPFGERCERLHFQVCSLCYLSVLHPFDKTQRDKHTKECQDRLNSEMEYAVAVARSKDKICAICYDTVFEKASRERRFGILPNCTHIFCLDCIRKWRQASQFEHKVSRSCPVCRTASDFVCPSGFWVDTKEDKDKLLDNYRSALGAKDCKYFSAGKGKCPFGNKCFYKHALPNGEIVDVGQPRQSRRIRQNPDEIVNLLDVYLWQFVNQPDYNLLEILSNPTDSEDSDYSDDYLI